MTTKDCAQRRPVAHGADAVEVPGAPRILPRKKKQYGQVQFNTDIKYGDWMNERTKLHSEKKKLQQEVESLKADALNRMNAQTKLAEDMETKIVKLQEEMSFLRKE